MAASHNQCQPGNSELNELDRAIGIFGRATTETHLDPSDRYDAIKHVRDYLFGLRERLSAPAQCGVQCGDDPFNRKQVEAICRAVCEVEGLDPDDTTWTGDDPPWTRYADAVAAALSLPADSDLQSAHKRIQELQGENDRLSSLVSSADRWCCPCCGDMQNESDKCRNTECGWTGSKT